MIEKMKSIIDGKMGLFLYKKHESDEDYIPGSEEESEQSDQDDFTPAKGSKKTKKSFFGKSKKEQNKKEKAKKNNDDEVVEKEAENNNETMDSLVTKVEKDDGDDIVEDKPESSSKAANPTFFKVENDARGRNKENGPLCYENKPNERDVSSDEAIILQYRLKGLRISISTRELDKTKDGWLNRKKMIENQAEELMKSDHKERLRLYRARKQTIKEGSQMKHSRNAFYPINVGEILTDNDLEDCAKCYFNFLNELSKEAFKQYALDANELLVMFFVTPRLREVMEYLNKHKKYLNGLLKHYYATVKQ